MKYNKIANNYHERDICSSTFIKNQICDCCNNKVLTRYCIEHDSLDFSKDLHICLDCYYQILNVWKEKRPGKIFPGSL
jgi:hypothetical protein